MALMLWLPVMVQSLLSGGDPTELVANKQHQPPATNSTSSSHGHSGDTGTMAVLLTAIPFTCAALLTTCLGALAQHTGRPLIFNFAPNLVGGTAFLVFPWVVHQSRVAGFAMLTIALAAGYSASPHPMTAITQITARVMASQQTHSRATAGGTEGDDGPSDAQATALALPMYNTVAMLGGFFGPWLLGIAIERLGGFSAGAVAMGVCMLAAGVCVLLLCCLHPSTAASGLYVPGAVHSCSSSSSNCGAVELTQHDKRASTSSNGGVRSRPPSSCDGSGRVSNSSGRRKALKSDGEAPEAEQLLQEAVAGGVSHDVEPMAWREGSSPRMRFQRGKQPLP